MSQSICCIIGYGRIGKIYENTLHSLGYKTILVDPLLKKSKKNFPNLNIIPNELRKCIHFWIITAPTEHHFYILKDVLHLQGNATILIEKPVCAQSDIDNLVQTIALFSNAKVLPVELYLHSHAIQVLLNEMQNLGLSLDQCRSIYIESTKNRQADNKAGRYIDNEFGLFGYEFLHLLTILSKILDDHLWQEFLCLHESELKLQNDPEQEDSNSGTVSLSWMSASGMNVTLYSSTSGKIGDPKADEFHMPSQIPYGDNQKYRMIVLEFEHCELRLRLEPIDSFKGQTVDRQIHLLVIKQGNSKQERLIKDNAFENALKDQLQWTDDKSIHTPEHAQSLMKESLTRVQFLGKIKKITDGKKEEIL